METHHADYIHTADGQFDFSWQDMHIRDVNTHTHTKEGHINILL